MSGFVCILHRDGSPVDREEIRPLAEAMSAAGAGRGRLALARHGPLAVAVLDHPSASGAACGELRQGPLLDAASGRLAALAGRFHGAAFPPSNGGSWEEPLSVSSRTRPSGGAAYALGHAGDAGGELGRADQVFRFLTGVTGSFALLLADPARGWVRIARDHLGDVGVYFHLDAHRLLAASEPGPLLRHPAVSVAPDEAAAARFLGFRSDSPERSFFRGIRVVPPGHALLVTAVTEEVAPYWHLRRLPAPPERSTEEVADDFLERLRDAVAASVADLAPRQVALSLSGGLDSTALAVVAPPGVRAFTWTLGATPEADERSRVEGVTRHLALPVQWIDGEGAQPLLEDLEARFVHPGSPFLNPFAPLKERLFATARSEGCCRVMVGDGGDVLYAAREQWLRELLAERRPGALGSLAGTVRRAAGGDRFARLSLRSLAPALLRTVLGPVLRPVLASPPGPGASWLTPEARAVLPPVAPSPLLPPGPAGLRWERIGWGRLSLRTSELESEERRLFARCGVERANPYWSWPLLERVMQLPAWLHHRDGRQKVLTRLALRHHLPEPLLAGGRRGLLGGFFLRGLELRRTQIHERVFARPRSDWQRWVRRDRIEPFLADTRAIAFGHTILWRVIGYELWQRRLLDGRARDGGAREGG